MKIAAILLIVAGALALLFGGFRVAYPDNVIDAGPLHVSVTKHRSLLVPPIIGGIVVAAGVAMLVAKRD